MQDGTPNAVVEFEAGLGRILKQSFGIFQGDSKVRRWLAVGRFAHVARRLAY
jgi:hypothetical protein